MRLPARLRWTTPLGQKIELAETMDVSRGGLLLSSSELHAAGVPLWVTFPYDASLPDGQPEVIARVVRCDELPEVRGEPGAEKAAKPNRSARQSSAKSNQLAQVPIVSEDARAFALAIHFEGAARPASNGNRARCEPERRGNPRRVLAVPIRVRLEHVPWFEEAMSLDISARGIRFRSTREYATGDHLRITLEDAASAPWTGSKEFCATVVRVAPTGHGVAVDVAVCRA